MSYQLSVLADTARNVLQPAQVAYVSEAAPWVIWEEGKNIVRQLNRAGRISARVTRSHWFLRDQLVHFGSLHTMLKNGEPQLALAHPRAVGTVFHLISGASRNDALAKIADHLQFIHTASSLTARNIKEYGVPEQKIRVIPLGVDRTTFQPRTENRRASLRQELGIDADTFVVGSFQKDGVGWEKGLTPKLEKGPDVLAQTLAAAAKEIPLHVLLVGPARGYVAKQLTQRNIPYTSIGYLKEVSEVAGYYQALDAYLITARIEGGPKALLESWASGVPVVSTKVGLVPDLAVDEKTALLADLEQVGKLTESLVRLYQEPDLGRRLAGAALDEVPQYDWSVIAQRYFTELYQPLL